MIHLTNSTFRTKYAELIWDHCRPYPELYTVFRIALQDAERLEFDKASSINDGEDYERLGASDSFAKLKRTRLLKHTYHVVFYAAQLKDEAGGFTPQLLLMALLHDFGKHGAIRAEHASKKYTRHEQISANYGRSIMEISGEFSGQYIDTFVYALSHHHIDSHQNVYLYKLLNKADQMARILEKK